MKSSDKTIVDTVIYQCLGYKKGELVLIVTDEILLPLANLFHEGMLENNIEAMLLKIKSGRIHGDEPPYLVAESLNKCHIGLLITSKSLSHTKARQIASKRYGTRIASLPGLTKEMFDRALEIDYHNLKKNIKKLADIFTKGKAVRVTTDRGVDLNFSISGRRGFSDDGLYTGRGDFGNLPAGEVCIGPLEGTANGRLVIDGSVSGLGKVKKPVEIIVKDGLAKEISSLELKKLLKPWGEKALNIAEFGIGLNPKARITGRILEDEKCLKTAHIALGDNVSFGGNVKAPCHLDAVFLNPKVYVDGKLVV